MALSLDNDDTRQRRRLIASCRCEATDPSLSPATLLSLMRQLPIILFADTTDAAAAAAAAAEILAAASTSRLVASSLW